MRQTLAVLSAVILSAMPAMSESDGVRSQIDWSEADGIVLTLSWGRGAIDYLDLAEAKRLQLELRDAIGKAEGSKR